MEDIFSNTKPINHYQLRRTPGESAGDYESIHVIKKANNWLAPFVIRCAAALCGDNAAGVSKSLYKILSVYHMLTNRQVAATRIRSILYRYEKYSSDSAF